MQRYLLLCALKIFSGKKWGHLILIFASRGAEQKKRAEKKQICIFICLGVKVLYASLILNFQSSTSEVMDAFIHTIINFRMKYAQSEPKYNAH